MRDIYIYALLEPDKETVRYVGATCNVAQRLQGHLTTPDGSAEKYHWIQSLLAKREKPRVVVLETTNEVDARSREAYWINFHKSDLLLNANKGGYSVKKPACDVTVTMRLNKDFLDKVKNLAILRGLNYQSMIKQWVSEKLAHEELANLE